MLPGDSRQAIVDALSAFSEAPQTATSKVVHDLTDAGYVIVHRGELIDILSGLLNIINRFDPAGETLTNVDVARAKALLDILSD